jgi:hypothetical protein
MQENEMTIQWAFSESLGHRMQPLLAPPAFEDIINSIKNEMKVLCFHFQDCADHNSFSRAVYCIQVSELLFDLFFNSKHGYRAWYYRSPHTGVKNNQLFIKSVLPLLLGSDQTKDSRKTEESLNCYSAKVWLAEKGKEVDKKCSGCTGEWEYPQNNVAEIMNNRWEKAIDLKATCGEKAPYLTKIRIFGAFLNKQNDELIPETKRFRADQIYEFGWS